jgi:glycosyltransferase involved in cell wall biosynthesis
MGILINEVNNNARGGTELLIEGLQRHVSADLLSHFEIVPSRLRTELSPDKIKLYWAHDLPGDPECEHLKSEGWRRYDKLIFVSNWQMQKFIDYYQIPWSHCHIIQNAIEPIQNVEKTNDGPVKLIYHTTPHRGLELLVPAFYKLAEEHDVHLDVFSSFAIYGWPDRDKIYERVIDGCKDHPKITYHGYAHNDVVREYLAKADIFAYPCIWQETSCCALMEAMSAACVNVHPNLGCLYETSGNWTSMYQWDEDPVRHVNEFYYMLKSAVERVRTEESRLYCNFQKNYADFYYSWIGRTQNWTNFLEHMLRLKQRK